MIIDAQVESPPNDVPVSNSTNDKCKVRTVTTLDIQGTLWQCGLREICLAALWLPLGGLIFCYVTASIFQPDDIHETHCRVYNVVPSISAITGISPQRYVWRICIAFHLGPRLLIGSLYYNYHKQRNAHIIEDAARIQAIQLGEACYWLNLVELFALTGVTYVSNRENYFTEKKAGWQMKQLRNDTFGQTYFGQKAGYLSYLSFLYLAALRRFLTAVIAFFVVVHEKIFIVFMVAALLHMLCRARVGSIASDIVEPVRTNKLVWTLFYVAIASTVGLIVFFLRHRLLCRPLAFTWFSVCEYILATTNMAFHAIVVRDLPLHEVLVTCPTHKKDN